MRNGFSLFIITPVITHRVFQAEKLIARSSFNLIPDCAFNVNAKCDNLEAALFIPYAFNHLIYSERESRTFFLLPLLFLSSELPFSQLHWKSLQNNPNKDSNQDHRVCNTFKCFLNLLYSTIFLFAIFFIIINWLTLIHLYLHFIFYISYL